MSQSMTVLELQGEGEDWRLQVNGDWSLPAMAQVEAQLGGLPTGLHGTLICDWSRAVAPGIGPVWALLMRLPDFGAQARGVLPTGAPPHHLQLLQKLEAERHASAPKPPPQQTEGYVAELGRWSIFQGTHARGVV